MEKAILIFFASFISYWIARYAWNKYRLNKLQKDVWEKGFKDASDISGYDLAELLKQANERKRRHNDRTKKE